MNYRDTIEYREYCLSYYRDSKKSTIAQHYNKVSTQRPYSQIQVRVSDKCTNGRPQMHERASEANGYGHPTDSEMGVR